MLDHRWMPSANNNTLKARARIIKQLRLFFDDRHFLEVDTPLLSQASVPDPHIESFKIAHQTLYLQTSPEFAMKRLLAAGSGPIYQICKAFRQGESGHKHNPEFTLLEWYRPGFDHHDLMNEMDELLQTILNTNTAQRLSYQDVFIKFVDINPHTATLEQCQQCAEQHQIKTQGLEKADKDDWLNIILTHCIEPKLGHEAPLFIYDYPASQATLAKVRKGDPPLTERFEVYIKGLELANGFHELTDSKEQRARFEKDNQARLANGQATLPIDEYLLAALEAGLPNSAGIALGIDRLIMLALDQASLNQVIAFPSDRA